LSHSENDSRIQLIPVQNVLSLPQSPLLERSIASEIGRETKAFSVPAERISGLACKVCSTSLPRLSRTIHSTRSRSALQSYELRRTAACLRQPRSIRLHRTIFTEPRQCLAQNLRRADARRHHDAIVHPLPFAPRLHDSRPAQIGEMARYLRLPLRQDLNEIADTNLLFAHQVQQAQAGIIAQRLKETFHIELQ